MYELMLALSAVLFLGISVYYARHPAASVLHPMTFYLMFHALVFVVRPIFARVYDYRVMYDAIGFQPTEWQKTTVLICTNLTLVVFTAVCMQIGKDPLRFRQSEAERLQRAALLRSYWPLALIIAALGLWAVIVGLQFMATGDINEIREIDARTGAGRLVGVNGYFISMPLMLASLCAIIVYLGRYRPWTFVVFGLYALLKLGTGGRGQVVTAVVMVVLFYLFDRGRKWPTMTVLLVAAFGSLVFDQIGSDRGAGIREAIGIEAPREARVRDRSAEKPLETMDLANMEFFEYLVWAIPERTGTYDYFVHNLQLFTEPVPRALWPDKPVGPPILMYDLYRYAIPLGATSSVAGQGWASMGYAGVVIWSALFALLYGGAYRIFARSSGSNLAVITYVIFASTSVLAFRDGVFMTILKVLQFYFVPILALLAVKMYLGHNTSPAGQVAAGHAVPASRGKQRRLAILSREADEAVPAALSADTPRARRLARLGH